MALAQMIESVIIFLVCVAAWIASGSYPDAAAMVPRLASAVAALLSLMLFFSSLKKYRAGNDKPSALINERIVKFFFIIVLYLAGIKIAGFYVSTTIYLIGASLYLKAKRKNIAIATVSFILFCFVFFYLVLGLKMPAGFLI